MTLSIPVQAAVDSSLQASKWQGCPLLIDINEMQTLLKLLEPFWIVQVSGIIPIGQEIISHDDFLEVYCLYVESIKRGEISDDNRIRPYFSAIFTNFLEALYAVQVKPDHYLVKVQQPVIQLQAHRFDYSIADATFRSMVMGYESVSWGIQFSYPHLYQTKDLQVVTVKESSAFPNTLLFKTIQRWMRSATIATPFERQGKRVNVPFRLGKQCLSWINKHPQLQAKGLHVLV